MKAKYLILLAIPLLVACSGKKVQERPEVPEVSVALPTVDSVTLHRTFPGYLKARLNVEVVARVSGTIKSKLYQDGQYVRQGQPLFTIESTTYSDAVQQAEAAFATAQSQYDYYKRQHAAMTKALQADAVSQMDVIQAESSMRQAEASIKNAKAQLQTARLKLGYCTVTAPVSGHITSAEIDRGNFVNGEASPVTLATIYDDSEMLAVFSVEDTQFALLVGDNGGQNAPIYRAVPLNFKEALKNNYTADLYYASPDVDSSTGTLTLKGTVKNPDFELKDGQYVTVSLPYGTNPHAVLVRDASIGTDQLGKYLYTVNDSDMVVYTPIEVGELYHDTLRIVNKGIDAKTRYVTKALLTVRNGEKIKPRK